MRWLLWTWNVDLTHVGIPVEGPIFLCQDVSRQGSSTFKTKSGCQVVLQHQPFQLQIFKDGFLLQTFNARWDMSWLCWSNKRVVKLKLARFRFSMNFRPVFATNTPPIILAQGVAQNPGVSSGKRIHSIFFKNGFPRGFLVFWRRTQRIWLLDSNSPAWHLSDDFSWFFQLKRLRMGYKICKSCNYPLSLCWRT